MKIIQMKVFQGAMGGAFIYGLGDDGLVYQWDFNTATWVLYAREGQNENQ
jgi:hypothetical protein